MLSSSPGDAVVHEGRPIVKSIAEVTKKGSTKSGYGTELSAQAWAKGRAKTHILP